MDNYSKEQLIRLPLISRFLAWLRREQAAPQKSFSFEKWARDRGGLNEEGQIKPSWAKKMYLYFRDKEDISENEKIIRKRLEAFLLGEDPEAMFE
jgi:hypothetical protein